MLERRGYRATRMVRKQAPAKRSAHCNQERRGSVVDQSASILLCARRSTLLVLVESKGRKKKMTETGFRFVY